METLKLLYLKIVNHPLLRHKQVFWALKFSIITLLLYAIYHRISSEGNLEDLSIEFISNLGFPNLYWAILVVLFIPLTALLEGVIWLSLIKKVEPSVTFRRVLKSVLAGFSLAVFSPNGVAKTLAPIMLIRTKKKVNLFAAVSVSEIAKQTVVLIFSSIASGFIINDFFDFEPNTYYTLVGAGAAFSIYYVLVYFNIGIMVKIVRRIKWLNRLEKHIKVLEQFSKKELLNPLLKCTLRYIVMITQYYFLLKYFGIEVPFFTALGAVAVMYGIRTFIFLPPSLSIFFRTELAILFWGVYSDNMVAIVAVELVLWFINVVIPALIGAILIGGANLRSILLIKEED